MLQYVSRFLLEPLEPRRFLDGAVFENIGANQWTSESAPVLDAPFTVHQSASARNSDWEGSYDEFYRMQVRAGHVYTLKLNHSAATQDDFVILFCPPFDGMHNEDNRADRTTIQLRASRDGICEALVETKNPGDYTLNAVESPFDAAEGIRQAPLLEPGTIADQFKAPGELHWYRFKAIAQSRYDFATVLSSLSQNVFRVLDENGQELDRSHVEWDGGGRAASLQWIAPTSGDYYLEVDGYSAGDSQLALTARIDDQLGLSAAFPNSGIARGSIDFDEDIDDFTFFAEPGNIYTFRLGADSAISPDLSLSDVSGDAMMARTMVYSQYVYSFTSFQSIVWSPPQSGMYRLSVWFDVNMSARDHLPRGQYSVFKKVVPISALPADVPTISPGKYQGQMDGASPKVYRFDAIKGSLYTFGTDDDTMDGHLIQVIDADGNVLANNSIIYLNNNIALAPAHWIAPASGQYFIRIFGIDPDAYTLIMAANVDDQAGEAVDISVPGKISGRLDFTTQAGLDDVDLFRFHAEAGKRYRIVDAGDYELAMLDEQGAALGQQIEVDWETYDGTWTAPSSGSYYLQVMGDEVGAKLRYERNVGRYSLSITDGSKPTAPPKPVGDDENADEGDEESDSRDSEETTLAEDSAEEDDSSSADSSAEDSSDDFFDDSNDVLDADDAELW